MMPMRSWMVEKPMSKVLFIGMSLAISMSVSCGAFSSGGVDAPTLSPSTSIFFSTLDITLATTTADAEIRYTTDGTEPSSTHGATYGGPVRVDKSETLRAVAFKSNGATSDVSQATYTKVGHVLGVRGSSASAVWTVGGYYDYMAVEPLASLYNGSTWAASTLPSDASVLMSVWAAAADDVFVVGLTGKIAHYDGSSWSSMVSGTTNNLFGVWGLNGHNVFAVGDGGLILRYNGVTWTSMTSPTTNELYGIFGTSSTAVMAVGASGTTLAYGGGTWGTLGSGTTEDLRGIWGTSPSNMYAIGDSGTIIWWNGAVWSAPVASGTTEDLRGIWGFGTSSIFVVGQNGTIRYYNGTSWTTSASGVSSALESVWGSSFTDVFAVGMCGTVLHFDGVSWSQPWGTSSNCVPS